MRLAMNVSIKRAHKMKFSLLLICLLSFVGEIVTLPEIRPQSERGIIFPAVDQYDECFVDAQHQVKGTCKTILECPKALKRWREQNIHPQTCYFNKFDHFVCCEKENGGLPPFVLFNDTTTASPILPTLPTGVNRRSEDQCELTNGPKFAVVHGVPTKPKEFPFMAALGWRSNFNDLTVFRCGGALISRNYVLTAAHCVELGGESPHIVRLGGVNLTDPNVEDIPIKRVVVHPGYNITSSYNDIALIELEKEAAEDPACVWSEEDLEHSNVTAIGYGHTRFAGTSSDQLLKASLFLVSNDICENYYTPDTDLLPNGVASTHLCAGDPERLRDTCQGDSGGPIIMTVERFFTTVRYVVGITSFGQGCAGGPPSVYTRTSSYIDWIEDIVWPSKRFDIRNSKLKV